MEFLLSYFKSLKVILLKCCTQDASKIGNLSGGHGTGKGQFSFQPQRRATPVWTIKKAERWRIDAFELWCWRRLLRFSWTARRSSQPIIKEISPGCSLEGLMLKMKLQYFGHLMQRADSFENTLMLGKNEDGRRRGRQMMRWLDVVGWPHQLNGHEFGWTPGVQPGRPGMLWFMGSQRVGHDWVTELNWTEKTEQINKQSKTHQRISRLFLGSSVGLGWRGTRDIGDGN